MAAFGSAKHPYFSQIGRNTIEVALLAPYIAKKLTGMMVIMEVDACKLTDPAVHS